MKASKDINFTLTQQVKGRSWMFDRGVVGSSTRRDSDHQERRVSSRPFLTYILSFWVFYVESLYFHPAAKEWI